MDNSEERQELVEQAKDLGIAQASNMKVETLKNESKPNWNQKKRQNQSQ